MRCVSEDVCAVNVSVKWLELWATCCLIPRGDSRSVSLTAGLGEVCTLLADGDCNDGCLPFFSSSLSTADPRRCFNHLCYGRVARQPSSHSLPFPEDTFACRVQHMYTYSTCTHVFLSPKAAAVNTVWTRSRLQNSQLDQIYYWKKARREWLPA